MTQTGVLGATAPGRLCPQWEKKGSMNHTAAGAAAAAPQVGVLTMAGKTPRVLVTPTPDLGKVLNAMQVRAGGGAGGRVPEECSLVWPCERVN